VINGKLYVAGGQGSSVLEMYDPATNRWSTRAGMSVARHGPVAAVINGLLYVVGGFDGGNYLASAEAYDPGTNTWRPVIPAFTARQSLNGAAVGKVFYTAGGFNGAHLATVEAYTP
jgi:N-acetylneuraminic acid mutarotase